MLRILIMLTYQHEIQIYLANIQIFKNIQKLKYPLKNLSPQWIEFHITAIKNP